ncbi:Protein phosphatase 1E [Homalodisca vitripennis]|nr:Protein phosphatase 1E [Homalodisca vitripennis]
MQTCIAKLVDVCARYQDNAELSSLPPPHPHPPTSSCAVKNSRRSMEDRHVVIHDFHTLFNIKDYGPASYYGVFDGHNGIDAAVYSVSHLHQYLAESQHYPSQPLLAMREACIRTDDLFTSKADKENLHGGTTAVYALLRPKEQKLYVGWLGDSLAVLVRRGVPYQIVQAHKPDRSDERDRIEKLGGTILYWGAWRVNGQLAGQLREQVARETVNLSHCTKILSDLVVRIESPLLTKSSIDWICTNVNIEKLIPEVILAGLLDLTAQSCSVSFSEILSNPPRIGRCLRRKNLQELKYSTW